MDKKLLDKLNGFNLSMQQKKQLVELIQEAGGGSNSNSGGGSSGGESCIINVNIITKYEQEPIIKIGTFEIPMSEFERSSDNFGTELKIYNSQLYRYLKDGYQENCKIVITTYTENLEYNLVRPSSYVYPATFGYTGYIPNYFEISMLLGAEFITIKVCE